MKKTLKICIISSALMGMSHLIHAQVATWMGTDDDQSWHNPSNWSWSDGSTGVPNEGIDIYFPESSLDVLVLPDSVAKCRNISGPFFEISLRDNAILKVYGNVSSSADYPGFIQTLPSDLEAESMEDYIGRLEFVGEGDQYMENASAYLGHLVVNKPSGNLLIKENAQLMLLHSINLENGVASIGSAPEGNIILEGGILVCEPTITFGIPSYTSSQVPPHVVINKMFAGEEDYVTDIFAMAPIFEEDFGELISGEFSIPVGASASSFTPVSLKDAGAGIINSWAVYATSTAPENCNESFGGDNSSQVTWHVMPLDLTGEFIEVYPTLSNPVEVTFEYNTANVGHDVTASYNDENLKVFIDGEDAYCEAITPSVVADGSIRKVTLNSVQNFSQFNIGTGGSTGINDAGMNETISLYPNPTQDQLNIHYLSSHEPVEIRIYSVEGKEVYHQSFGKNALNQEQILDVKALPAGNYLVKGLGTDIQFNQIITKQ